MSGRKTRAALLCAAALWAASLASAEHVPRTAEERLSVFAQCAGRFSAQMEHAWLLGLNGTSAQEGRRQMVLLIDALGPLASMSGADVLALRIDGKMAHAALLTRATFRQDPQARRLARLYIASCAALLPGPLDLVSLP